MDIMTALSAATKSLELVKGLKDLNRQISEAELKSRAAELLSSLADLKIALVDARDEIDAKAREIAGLKAAFQLRGECVRQGNFLYDRKSDGAPIGHPYCSRCEQIDGVMIKLTYDAGERGNAICPECKTKYRHVQVFH
jgi:hypothetical protein